MVTHGRVAVSFFSSPDLLPVVFRSKRAGSVRTNFRWASCTINSDFETIHNSMQVFQSVENDTSYSWPEVMAALMPRICRNVWRHYWLSMPHKPCEPWPWKTLVRVFREYGKNPGIARGIILAVLQHVFACKRIPLKNFKFVLFGNFLCGSSCSVELLQGGKEWIHTMQKPVRP